MFLDISFNQLISDFGALSTSKWGNPNQTKKEFQEEIQQHTN